MTIGTENGDQILHVVYFTELGFLMAKIFNPKEKTYTNKKIANLESLLNDNNITIKGLTSYKKSRIKKMIK